MIPAHINIHLLHYWDRCRRFFEEGDYPFAAFSAITLIEEIGKIPMLALPGPDGKPDLSGFRNHQIKYSTAVGSTLFVNSRVTQVYGEREIEFARLFRSGELFRIRNSALYIDHRNGTTEVPNETITRDRAFLFVCFAGEILAESQGLLLGTGPDAWERIIAEVDAFRVRYENPA